HSISPQGNELLIAEIINFQAIVEAFCKVTNYLRRAIVARAETLIHNKTQLDGVDIPAVEVVFSLNKNFKREKHQWIYSEASKVISLMTQWTGFPYPLEALRIISAPIQASSHSSLGLITLQV
ncbi:hypothetical protein TELCIR_21363, partial [Teladorsagia circumcincta]